MYPTQTSYRDIASLFIRARLGETDWQHHQYIDDLVKLADCIERHGPCSWAGALIFGKLKATYSIEYLALTIEHDEGRALSTDEFLRLQKEAHQISMTISEQRLKQEYAQRRQELREKRRAYAAWRTAGGRS